MGSSPSLPLQPDDSQVSLRFFLLGPPILTWNGVLVSIPRRSVRALLYHLASNSEPVPRGNLQLLFWPDVPEVVARRNLSHYLTHLRRSLPLQSILSADSARIWLEPGMAWSDVLEFQGADLGSRADSSTLIKLADLYRGPFMAGFDLPGCGEYEQWCILERVALENQYLKILGRLVEHCSSRGETGKAIYWAQRYLETDPLSEAMHGQLIQLFAAAGDRHLAFKQYESCRTILESELGVSPLPETKAIYQAVLQSWHRFPISPASTPRPRLPVPDIPILGRETELELLEDAFDNLQAHHSQVLLISGEAGIGKSRLIQHFADNKLKSAKLLYGAAYAGEEAIPYQPILGAFRTILNLEEPGKEKTSGSKTSGTSPSAFVEPLWLSEISRLFPEIQVAYPGLPPPLPGEPECIQARLFVALCRLLLAYVESQGPLLFCLDDLQWTDASTLAWLAHMGRMLEKDQYPILILGTYRSEEAEAILDLRRALARTGKLSEIVLGGLGEAAVVEIIRSQFGERPAEVDLARRLQRATGGNPFYLIEILRQRVDESLIEDPLTYQPEFRIPESIREVIQARLDRLSPLSRQVLEAAAIAGQSFGLDLLRLAAGRSDSEILVALDELTTKLLLVGFRGGYRFNHELTRQHVQAGLDQVRRQLLHNRVGRALQNLQPGAHTRLAHHFEAGGDLRKALHYHALVSQSAKSLFSWQVAEFHQGRMLAIVAVIDPGCTQPELIQQRADILAERAHSRYLQGRLIERDFDLAALFDLGEACNNDSIRLQAILNRLRYLNMDGEYLQAVDMAKKGLELLQSSKIFSDCAEQERIARSRLFSQMGFAYYFLGRPEEAIEILEDALRLYGEHLEPEPCGRIKQILGYVYFHLGDYRRSLEYQQCAYRCHQEIGDENRVAWDLIDLGAMHKNLGELNQARDFIWQGLELSERIQAKPAIAYGLAHAGSLELYQGNYPAATDFYKKSLEIEEVIQSENILATAEAGIGLASYHLGDTDQSHLWFERALERARESGQLRRVAETLIQLSLLNMLEGDLDSARHHLDEGMSIAEECQSGEGISAGLAALARLERLSGNPVSAREHALEAICASQQRGLACCEMWGEIEAGLACLLSGEPVLGLEHTQRAVNLSPLASQDWIGREEAHRAQALVLRALGQVRAAKEQDRYAEDLIREKAGRIPDSVQRRRFLEISH